jgi:hypothetical protein
MMVLFKYSHWKLLDSQNQHCCYLLLRDYGVQVYISWMEYLRDSLFERLLCKRLLHEGCLSCCSFLKELGGRQDLGTRVDSSYWYQLFVSIQSCSVSDT